MSQLIEVCLTPEERELNWAQVFAPRTVTDIAQGAPAEIRYNQVQVIGYAIRNGIPVLAYYRTPSMGKTYRIADISEGKLYDQPD